MRWRPTPFNNSNKVGASVSVQSHRNKCFALTLLAFSSIHALANPALLEVVPGGDCPETSFTSSRKDTSTGLCMSIHLPFRSVKGRCTLPLHSAGSRKEMGHHPEEGKRQLGFAASTEMTPATG